MRNNRDRYLKDFESTLDDYKKKLQKIGKKADSAEGDVKKRYAKDGPELKKQLDKAEGFYEKLKSATEDEFEELKDSGKEVFEELKAGFEKVSKLLSFDNLTELKDEVAEYGKEAVEQVEVYVKRNPIYAVAGAAVIGFLLGELLNRSR